MTHIRSGTGLGGWSLLIGTAPTSLVAQDAVQPEVQTPTFSLERPEKILHMVPAPDGGLLYVADFQGGVLAWNCEKGEPQWTVKGRGSPCVGIAANEEMVVLAKPIPAFDGLDAEIGSPIRGTGAMGPGVGTTSSVACDPKGRWVWFGTQGGLMRVTIGDDRGWSKRSLPNGGTTCLAMDPKAKLLAAGGADGSIRFAGAKSANVDDKKVIEAHEGEVDALAFDARGSLVVSTGKDAALRVWKVSNGRVALEIAFEARARVLACDPKKRWIAVGDVEGAVRLYGLKKGELVATLAEPQGTFCAGLAFLDSGKTLAAASDTHLRFWNLSEL